MYQIMTDKPTKPEIVQFDVGGRVFKTSRSLIDQHEDTMLARLMSDTWQEDPNKSVFIDRNGDTFSHILDYLRYGSNQRQCSSETWTSMVSCLRKAV